MWLHKRSISNLATMLAVADCRFYWYENLIYLVLLKLVFCCRCLYSTGLNDYRCNIVFYCLATKSAENRNVSFLSRYIPDCLWLLGFEGPIGTFHFYLINMKCIFRRATKPGISHNCQVSLKYFWHHLSLWVQKKS